MEFTLGFGLLIGEAVISIVYEVEHLKSLLEFHPLWMSSLRCGWRLAADTLIGLLTLGKSVADSNELLRITGLNKPIIINIYRIKINLIL